MESHRRLCKPVVAAIVALDKVPIFGVRAQSSSTEALPPGGVAATGEKADDLDWLTSMGIDQLVNVDASNFAATIPAGTLTAASTDSLLQGGTAAPNGFGSEFVAQSPWPAKVARARDLDDRADLNNSLRDYSGFTGARDSAKYKETLVSPGGSVARADQALIAAFEASDALEIGYHEQRSDRWSCRVDLYNLLGRADVDFNKRNYLNRVSNSGTEAAAVGVSV